MSCFEKPTLAGFILKKQMRDKSRSGMDKIPGGNDHFFDMIRYSMTEDVLRG